MKPIATSVSRFADLCQQMFHVLETQGNMQDWARAEQEAFDLVAQGRLHVDKHILRPALIGSGSGRLIRLLYEQAAPDSFQRFLDDNAVNVQFRALENLSNVDIDWLLKSEMKARTISQAVPLIMSRRCRVYTGIVAEALNMDLEATLATAPFNCSFTWKPMGDQAPLMAEGLRRKLKSQDGHDDLIWIFSKVLKRNDLRGISAMIHLDFEIPDDDLPLLESADLPIRNLLEVASSNHGKLQLLRQEPSLEDILSRPDGSPFYGLTEADL